jgi:hypothetical protein
MPFIGEHSGRQIRVKEAGERRHEISEVRKARQQAPATKE